MNDIANDGDTVRALREELARLSARVASLEAAAFRAQSAQRADAGPDEKLMAVLAAAVAAYLGKKPRIRSVRVVSSPEWARQGRLHIQASHALGPAGGRG